MNPNRIETYIEGLNKTLQDKLFFLNVFQKDYFKNKIIIDFGCGDGSVLEYISRHCDITDSILIGVDINDSILEYAKQKNIKDCVFVNSLAELDWSKKTKDIIIIATSVLHELGYVTQKTLFKFVAEHASCFIVRDMCFTYPKQGLDVYDYKDIHAKIIRNSNSKLLTSFVEKYGLVPEINIAHYLMKYTYVENWDTELEEDYTSVDWLRLERIPTFEISYDRTFIQEWRRNQVMKDFDIDIEKLTQSTHRELIMVRQK